MPVTMPNKEELQERAQLVRIHEANCQIDHPTPEEANFRLAIMKRIAERYSLRELRLTSITGPGIKTVCPDVYHHHNPKKP